MLGVIHPLPQYVFTAWCIIKQWLRLHGLVLVKHNFTINNTNMIVTLAPEVGTIERRNLKLCAAREFRKMFILCRRILV